ncbi:threalose-6-phosphate phosphatase [Rhizina undulata]
MKEYELNESSPCPPTTHVHNSVNLKRTRNATRYPKACQHRRSRTHPIEDRNFDIAASAHATVRRSRGIIASRQILYDNPSVKLSGVKEDTCFWGLNSFGLENPQKITVQQAKNSTTTIPLGSISCTTLDCMEELRRVMKELGHNVRVMPERLRIVVRHRLVHKGKDAKRLVMDRPDGSTGYLGFVFCSGDGVSDECPYK